MAITKPITGSLTFTPVSPKVDAFFAPDPLEEARRERQLAEQAARELEASIEGARALFGDTLADALTRAVDRAAGGFAVSCDRFEEAVGRLKEISSKQEAEIVDRGRRVTELAADLAKAREDVARLDRERADWKRWCEAAELHSEALRLVLRRAVVAARRWSGKKKGRRLPGFVKAAEILLDGGDR